MRALAVLDRFGNEWRTQFLSSSVAVGALALMLVEALLLIFLPGHVFVAISLAMLIGLILVVHPRAYLALYLATGGVSLAIFASDRRELLQDFGGMEPDGLRLLAFISGSLLLLVLRPHLLSQVGRYRLALAFVLMLAASLLYSPSVVEGIRLLLKICFPLVTYVLVVSEVQTESQMRHLLRACLWGIPLVALLSVIRAGAGETLFIVDSAGSVRFQGSMGTSTLAFYCTCLSLLLYSYGTTRGKRHWPSIAGALVLGAVVVATGTRVAVAGLLAAIVTVECVRKRVRRGLVIGACILIAIFLLSPVLQRFAYSRDTHDLLSIDFGGGFWASLGAVNTSGRDMLWRRVWEDLVVTSPLFGHGMGSANHYLTVMMGTSEGAVPHNEILRILADAGLVGALLGVALGMVTASHLWKTRLPDDDRYEFLRPLAIASCVTFVLCSITDNTLEYYAVFTGYVATFAALLQVRARQLGHGAVGLNLNPPSSEPPRSSS